jgi:sugar transferase EpsL
MYRGIKYSFDVAITLAGSIVLLPLSALVALSLWLTQENVLFRQRRPGLHGKPFILYKFRTMTDARDKDGNLLPDEQRITKIGALVRNLSLDELPQFWNVIKGEMSLVGPRPLLMEYLTRYTPEEARRHNVTPGITGWAQVNGRNAISWQSKFALDVWYVDHASFFLDLRILWMTCRRVIRRSGISNQGHATMPQFMGTNVEN